MNFRAFCNDFLDISLSIVMFFCIFISSRGINTILESAKVSQTMATRSRHVSRSDSVISKFFYVVYSLTRAGDMELPLHVTSWLTARGIRERHGPLLFAQRRESATKVIAASRFAFFLFFRFAFFLFCHFF